MISTVAIVPVCPATVSSGSGPLLMGSPPQRPASGDRPDPGRPRRHRCLPAGGGRSRGRRRCRAPAARSGPHRPAVRHHRSGRRRRDLDQALHIERAGDGFVVHYAIADVAAFVTAGDPIDVEANKPRRDALRRRHARSRSTRRCSARTPRRCCPTRSGRRCCGRSRWTPQARAPACRWSAGAGALHGEAVLRRGAAAVRRRHGAGVAGAAARDRRAPAGPRGRPRRRLAAAARAGDRHRRRPLAPGVPRAGCPSSAGTPRSRCSPGSPPPR